MITPDRDDHRALQDERIRADLPFGRGPLRNLGDVELITADYVSWNNQKRLLRRLGRIPPAEAEAQLLRVRFGWSEWSCTFH